MTATVPGYVEIGRRSLPGRASWTVVDVFARARGTNGNFPAAFGPMRVLCEERDENGQWRALPTPLDAAFLRGPSGTVILTGRTVLQPGRTLPEETIPPGRYRGHIVSAYYQAHLFEEELRPGKHSRIELLPGYAYPFPLGSTSAGVTGPTLLRGAIRTFAGVGIAGVSVKLVHPKPGNVGATYETDESGQWMLMIPDDATFKRIDGEMVLKGRIEMKLPGAVAFPLAGFDIVRGRENGLAQTAIRGAVLRTSGAAIAGATVTVANHPGRVVSRPGGEWFYYFHPQVPPGVVTITVTAPDGETQRLRQIVADRAMTTVPTFRFP
jgi:hypothetical protein